jgi:hypothetical protein
MSLSLFFKRSAKGFAEISGYFSPPAEKSAGGIKRGRVIFR